MNPHLQPLMSEYAYNPFASSEGIARSMLRIHGKLITKRSLRAIQKIMFSAMREPGAPCRDEVIEALEREISNAEPRRRV